jgi:hypothetical protein
MEKEYIETRIQHWIQKGIKYAIMGIVYATVSGFVVMYLWNWLAPSIISATTITFWQALGIWALAKVLFGGRGWGGRGHHRHHGHKHGGSWRAKWEEKWEKMTPEQQAEMKARWGKHCGKGWGGNWQGGDSRKAETKAEARAQAAANSSAPKEPFSPVQDDNDQAGA